MDHCCDYTSLVILATTHCSLKSQTTPESLLVSTESLPFAFLLRIYSFQQISRARANPFKWTVCNCSVTSRLFWSHLHSHLIKGFSCCFTSRKWLLSSLHNNNHQWLPMSHRVQWRWWRLDCLSHQNAKTWSNKKGRVSTESYENTIFVDLSGKFTKHKNIVTDREKFFMPGVVHKWCPETISHSIKDFLLQPEKLHIFFYS